MAEVAEAATEEFTRHRDLLLAVAYRILGRWTEAEDTVQDAWLRWAAADPADVRDARGWLVTVTTRLAIDRLRRAKARQETYVGPWLPEPVLTTADVADRVATDDTVSLAMLVVLETLSPLERAVFVLREAFDYPYADIAAIVGRAEAAVRQVARRARAHVDERAPRYETDAATRAAATQRFLDACAGGGRIADLIAALAPDVTLVADGGGVAKAPRRVLVGADKVARFLVAVANEPIPDLRVEMRDVNGTPAAVVYAGDEPVTVVVVEVAGERIASVQLVADPRKLAGVRGAPVAL